MNTERGYLYIATGDRFIEEAVHSAKSLRKVTPDARIALVTDQANDHPVFDRTVHLKLQYDREGSWRRGNLYKLVGLKHSPFEKTFFIDTDTHFCEQCEELFDLLDYFDLLISPTPADKKMVILDGRELEGYYSYNTGVMVYNNKQKFVDFIQAWIDVYKKKFDVYGYGQPAFMEALLSHPLNIYPLQPIYNLRLPFFANLIGKKVKILHGRSDRYEQIEQKVNSYLRNRAWHPRKKKIYKNRSWRQLIYEYTPQFLVDYYRKYLR